MDPRARNFRFRLAGLAVLAAAAAAGVYAYRAQAEKLPDATRAWLGRAVTVRERAALPAPSRPESPR